MTAMVMSILPASPSRVKTRANRICCSKLLRRRDLNCVDLRILYHRRKLNVDHSVCHGQRISLIDRQIRPARGGDNIEILLHRPAIDQQYSRPAAPRS